MKNNKKRKLRKCNVGVSPVGINTNYTIPNPVMSNGMQQAANQGWNNSMASAGQRVRMQGLASNVGGIANDALGAVTGAIGMFKSPEVSEPATRMTSGPLTYAKQDNVDSAAETAKVKKENLAGGIDTTLKAAKLGSALGPIGAGVGAVVGGITSIFGANKRRKELKRKLEEQGQRTIAKNTMAQSTAHGNQIQAEYDQEFEDTTDDVLYNDGKTPFTNGKRANALVGKGETIVDGNTGDMTEVTQGSGIGNDDVTANIKPQDAIAGNKKNPRTGNTFAEDMKPLTRMESKLKRNTERNVRTIARNTEQMVKSFTQPMAQAILADQAMVHRKQGSKPIAKYSIGKIAEDVINYGGQALGEVTTLAPSIYNLAKGRQQPDQVSADQLYSPNANAYQASRIMGKRRYNDAPEIEALRGLETRQRYNSRQLGSEGGINRAMDIAGQLNTQRAISQVYSKKQNVDNAYRGEEAQMLAQLGAQEASNRSGAMRQAYDINARNKAMASQYKQAALQGFSQKAQLDKQSRNRQKMDDMRMRVLEKYYEMGTTNSNMSYIFGGNN